MLLTTLISDLRLLIFSFVINVTHFIYIWLYTIEIPELIDLFFEKRNDYLKNKMRKLFLQFAHSEIYTSKLRGNATIEY